MGSVETVTILITDLVGSTGLESRIGPAAAEEVRGEHFGLLRGEIGEAGGREVKNTGDGLMAAFGSAAAAVSCAVSMQQRFERRNRSAVEQLLIKVGLSSGDATVENGDYFGMPVIEASRLCDRCSGGQILAKELVAHLAGGRGHSFMTLGGLELKGLPEPLEAVEVVWEPLGVEAGSLPLPPRLQEMPPGGLVGRTAEVELLGELFAQASGGDRRLALLSGEPGIGKTRLSTHVALESRSNGAVVLYGRCDEELRIPYGPWVEALSHYVEHAPEEALSAHCERHGAELSLLVPALAVRLPGLPPARTTDPDTERYLLWGAVVGLLRDASAGEPLVLVLDDLHWADKPTLLLLKHLLVEGQGARALVIGTYRDSDLHRGHPMIEVLADLRREQGVERLALGGLAQEEIVEIMERAGGHELDPAAMALSRELYRETDGNPFYTGEILRHLLESGTIYQQENGRFTVRGELSERGTLSGLSLPQSVREVLGRRVERLGQETHSVLSVAAVIGREFDLDLLVSVSERSEDELLELLEGAVVASVLVESASAPGRFSFAHALINHTLYEELGTTRRARLHRRVADALEGLLGSDPGARVGELAHHWAQATTAVDIPKAVKYARLAGERALAELAPDEALRWFSQALELQPGTAGPAERCDLLIGLGEAQRQVGEPEYRETLLEASTLASELGDADRAARAALANSRGVTSAFGQVDEERIAALERALELDDDRDRRARLLSLQAMELMYAPDHEHRRGLADQALALARESGNPRTLARVLIDYLYTFWAPDALELRVELLSELRENAEAAGDPALEFWAATAELPVRVEAGDLERADATAQRMRAISEQAGEPTMRWNAAFCARGTMALLRGDLAAAERCSEQGLQIGSDAGEPDAFMVYGAQLTLIRELQGRSDEIVELLEQSVEANPLMPAWRAGLAWALCWLGRTEEAAAIVTEAARDHFDHVPWELSRTTALAVYADVAAQAGVTDAAALLYELIEPWGDQVVWNGAQAYGYARMYLGLLAATLGWNERADEHFKLACDFQERNGMLVWTARAHLGWAEALAARGDADRAQIEAARALEISLEHGYGTFEVRAAALLETGAPTPG